MRDILNNPGRVLDIMRDVADAEIMPRYRALAAHEITEKKPGDLVTIADKESEAALTRHLTALLPGSRVLGEEGYEADPGTLKILGGDAPVWIVDPVDGTHNFAHGKSPFTVIVALADQSGVRAGWIIDPVKSDAAWAIRGSGVCYQDAAGAVAVPDRPDKKFEDGVMTAGPKLQDRIARAALELSIPKPKLKSRYRCVGREYMDIAIGDLDFARYGGLLKPWDHAAGVLIVEEAGGRVRRLGDGSPYMVAPSLDSQFIGVAGAKAHWTAFEKLARRADELSG
ncbi:MAG: inositol monophosphatase [Rhodospirillales bacterium]|nr:inositol monophosphatase [Rhodospirillales bacterium]